MKTNAYQRVMDIGRDSYKRAVKIARKHGHSISVKRDLPMVSPHTTYPDSTVITMSTLADGGHAYLLQLTKDGPTIDMYKGTLDIALKHALHIRRSRLITSEQYYDLKEFYAECFAQDWD